MIESAIVPGLGCAVKAISRTGVFKKGDIAILGPSYFTIKRLQVPNSRISPGTSANVSSSSEILQADPGSYFEVCLPSCRFVAGI